MWDPQDTGEWWHQRPPFRQKIPPPTADVCDPPLVCTSFNQSYIPLILGALTALAQPSTWDTTDPTTRETALARAQDLIEIIGGAMPCASPPLIPSGGTAASSACNIAGYLSHVVIKQALQKAIDAINADMTVLGYGVAIVGLIPGVGLLIPAVMGALRGLYQAMTSGTLSHYQDAVGDDILWSHMTCAIYGAIASDGYVNDSNYPAVKTAICGVSYTHADVISAICDYVTAMGASGMEQLQQPGALAVYDCSGCGGGTATGPGDLPPLEDSGVVNLTITAGTSLAQQLVTFRIPFSAPPIVTVSCADQDFIASVDVITRSTFLLSMKSAVDQDSDITAACFWIAVQEGWL